MTTIATPHAALSSDSPTEPLAVQIRDLRVSYGKFEAVKGISIDIPKGEVFGFIGPNGAGKSTTIRVLATLQPKFRGLALVSGLDVLSQPHKVRERIGYMPDFFGVYEDLTALEYLHFFAAAYKLPSSRRRSIIDDVLALTDLTHKADAPVDGLSRGMKQRLALARVLLHDPELLLLDEPASGLDPRARIEVRELLVALKEMGKTILISSHILHELSQLCTRIGIIEAGEMVAEGSLEDIFRKLQLMRVIHVRFEAPADDLQQRIGQIPGVESVEQQVDRWAIRLHEDQMSVVDLHQALVDEKARIAMYQPEAMDMETAFMKLTEGENGLMAMWLPVELPLFRRELTELAQRRRTYLLRVFGAIILLTFVVYTVLEVTQTGMFLRQQGMMLSGAAIANAGLGIGGSVFDRIVPLLFLMIPALLPALCCSAITSEKEQNTFGTLLLTRLSPSTIILEKLLSRIVPMLTLLLLVSPVLAWVYSLGGVDPGMLFGAVWLLFCECLLFAALSLFFSAWFPSTVTTFVWSYIGAASLVVIGNIFPLTAFGAWNHEVGLDRISVPYAPAPLTGSGALFLALVKRSLIPLVLSLILLAATRVVIVRRAFVGHSSLVIRLFRHLDQFFKNLNAWTTGGIELVAESKALPDDDPVTWRERNKKSFGQFRWLVRILLVLEGPTLFVCAIASIENSMTAGSAITVLLTMLWVFAAVLAAVKGASLFSQERSRQTLEPLLSTTLTSHELVEQKVIGTNRLLLVLACPILTVHLTQAFMYWRSNNFMTMAYLAVATLLTFVILRTIVWITSAVGIWIRSQTKAIAVSMVLVGAVAVVPMIPSQMVAIGERFFGGNSTGLPLRLTCLGAPGAIASVEKMLLTNTGFRGLQYRIRGPRGWEVVEIPVEQIVVPAILVQLFYLLAARWFVLRLAPKLLQRLDEGQSPVLTLSARHAHA